jgi:hypothetical protein
MMKMEPLPHQGSVGGDIGVEFPSAGSLEAARYALSLEEENFLLRRRLIKFRKN